MILLPIECKQKNCNNVKKRDFEIASDVHQT